MHRTTLVLAPIILLFALSQYAAAATIQLAYLSPSDKAYRSDYEAAIKAAARDLQSWLARELAGHSFKENVSWTRLPNTEAWYQSNPTSRPHAARFWESVLGDAFALTGGRFDDPENVWIYYFDGDPLVGQYYGGTNGVALLPANDLRGLIGDPLVPIEPGDPTINPGFDRWVGGLGHELGHALGLDHPPDSPGGADDRSLMYLGYFDYPDTYLTEADKRHLLASPFIAPIPLPGALVLLASGLLFLTGVGRFGRLLASVISGPKEEPACLMPSL